MYIANCYVYHPKILLVPPRSLLSPSLSPSCIVYGGISGCSRVSERVRTHGAAEGQQRQQLYPSVCLHCWLQLAGHRGSEISTRSRYIMYIQS